MRLFNKKILIFYIFLMQIFIMVSFNLNNGLCNDEGEDGFIISITPLNNSIVENAEYNIIRWEYNNSYPLTNSSTNLVINCSSDFFLNEILMNVTGDISNIKLLEFNFFEFFDEYDINITTYVYNFSIQFILSYENDDEEIVIENYDYILNWRINDNIIIPEFLILALLIGLTIIGVLFIYFFISHRSCNNTRNILKNRCIYNKKRIMDGRGLHNKSLLLDGNIIKED